ncbi:hypothetical protein GCM10027566_28660 [Arachidicoccus ginsenosidivorans]|uniref:Helicase XPB/Ssl2 N-terminal domain-containing protein n=1 Tax=Arachidicoccus ginsenosidivorans TaxID=496057 RepID=A0A5B8VQJ3_9BACT|nr:hypothetical protein [Arachidicoccus ginsenosidivorans]QEC73740.1 hypothetical protein FSB73_20785 [Arachidicoccus ginsenosidivorans]
MKKNNKKTPLDKSSNRSSNKPQARNRRAGVWLLEAVGQVLGKDKQYPHEIDAPVLSQIHILMDKDIIEFSQHSGYFVQDIKDFSDWLIAHQFNSFKQALQLETLFARYHLEDQQEWFRKLCLLFFTDRWLLKFYYIYTTQIQKDGEFLDKLIWSKDVPYLQAKEHFGEEMIEDEYNELGQLVSLVAYRKWDSFLMESDQFVSLYPSIVENRRPDLNAEDRAPKSNGIKDHLEHNYYGLFAEDDSEDYDEDFDEDYDEDYDEDGCIPREDLIYVLPEFIQTAFKVVANKPEGAMINPVKIPENYLVYQAELAVYQDLPQILIYLQQGKLQYTKAGSFTVASLKNAAKKLPLHNFMNDTGYIKLLLMSTHLCNTKFKPTTPVLDILNTVFNIQQPNELVTAATLFPIENIKHIYNHFFRPKELTKAFDLLKLLPEGQWIELKSLLSFVMLNARQNGLNPIHEYALYDLRLSNKNPSREIFWISDIKDKRAYIERLFITGALFTAAAFGLLDLAYDPDNMEQLAGGYPSESFPWSSFTACRLTPLGAHIFQYKKDYVAPGAVSGPLQLELATDQLHIKVQGSMEIAQEMLRAWTKPSVVHPNLLELDEARIITRSKNKSDLVQQIREFKDTVALPLPDYWQAKLMQLIGRADRVQQVQAAVVYKLSPYDQRLHALVAQDAELNKYCLKAAQFMLIVLKDQHHLFIRRLAQLGYVPSDGGQGDPVHFEFASIEPKEEELCEEFKALMKKKKRK